MTVAARARNGAALARTRRARDTQPMIHLIHGPNLNLLGTRQPEIYGRETLADVEGMCRAALEGTGLGLVAGQSNHEGGVVDLVQAARAGGRGIVINAGAYTHTSVAILDALNMFEGPVIEIHISQVHKRESFRHHSYISRRADAVMAGFGVHGYELAMRHMARLLG